MGAGKVDVKPCEEGVYDYLYSAGGIGQPSNRKRSRLDLKRTIIPGSFQFEVGHESEVLLLSCPDVYVLCNSRRVK